MGCIMRITGGDKRGLKLISPRGDQIRPTSEKVRQAVFNMLYDRIQGCVFVDLCCGTGIMSFEALSRGADRAVLVDQSSHSRETAKRNLERTGYLDRAIFKSGKVETNLGAVPFSPDQLTIVYLDPPYANHRLYHRLFKDLDARTREYPVILVVEHPRDLALADGVHLRIQRFRNYGEKQITIFTSHCVIW